MSLLRNFSPGGPDPDDDDEQPTTAAEPDRTARPDVHQPSGTARYAFAAPAAGTTDPVPGTVVESEVVPDPGPPAEPDAAAESAASDAAAGPAAAADPDLAAAPGRGEDTKPVPVAETSAPETTPSPTFQPKPVPVPSPRATGEDNAAARPAGEPGTTFTGQDLTAPLLGDAAQLRARWQRIQSDFVDDPQASVSDAADLVGQTAEALVGALRQRQRQLRAAWEHGAASGSPDGQAATAMAAGVPDTEHLRLMIQRYRALFNELCRPS